MPAICLLPGAEPLQAAAILLSAIEAPSTDGDHLRDLCYALDAYVYAVGFVESPDVDHIESVDCAHTDNDDSELRKSVGMHFPQLGLYWQALDTEIINGTEGKLAVGDAIDDLLDIAKELREVAWFDKHHGKTEALAALRFRHSSHLYMHVFPLRLYLEEKTRGG